MPLSEEELRALEQMERALLEEDPKFASTLRGTTLQRTARRRAVAAGAVFVVGVCLLMSGAIANIPWLGVLGFVVMLGSATVGLTAIRGQQAAGDSGAAPSSSDHPFTVIDGGRAPKLRRTGRGNRSPSSNDSFMARMEDRWRRRREQGGGF